MTIVISPSKPRDHCLPTEKATLASERRGVGSGVVRAAGAGAGVEVFLCRAALADGWVECAPNVKSGNMGAARPEPQVPAAQPNCWLCAEPLDPKACSAYATLAYANVATRTSPAPAAAVAMARRRSRRLSATCHGVAFSGGGEAWLPMSVRG